MSHHRRTHLSDQPGDVFRLPQLVPVRRPDDLTLQGGDDRAQREHLAARMSLPGVYDALRAQT